MEPISISAVCQCQVEFICMLMNLNMDSMKTKIGIDFDNLSKIECAIMIVMMPIFDVVAGLEHAIAKTTGLTYNEVNILIYYLFVPLSSVLLFLCWFMWN